MRTRTLALLALFSFFFTDMNAAGTPPKKVLYFTKSSNFEHSVVRRKDGEPSFSEQVLTRTGPSHNIEFTFSKDGSQITPEYLAQFDAVMFYTSGNLCETGKDGNPPITPEGKAALLEAIKNGLGFVGIHSATDTFHTGETTATNTNQARTWRYENFGDKGDPYTRMLGSSFIIHDKQQSATALVIDPKFPGFAHLGEKHTCMEEWYSLNDFNRDLHVILATQTEGMSGPPYQRPNFPNTWAHLYGKGRVFYTALGHREDTWISRDFQEMLFGGIAWAVHNADADITPNIESITPGAWTLPPVSGPVAGLPKDTQATLQATQVPPTGTDEPAAPVARPRIFGISHAAVLSTNLEAARAFYKNYLGYDEPYTAKNPDGTLKLTWIKINDLQQIEIFPAKNPDDDRLYQVALITDDTEGMRQYLKTKGWKVPEKPVGRGTIGNANMTVKDPDGHTIEFVQYIGTGWTLKDKGLHMPATRIAARIRHIGIKVANLEASLHFYRDLLGCEETWRGSRDNKLLSWVNVRLPDCDEYLELMLYGGPEPKTTTLRSMNHICLEVSDVAATYDMLQKRTLPEGCPATTAFKTGVNGKRQINCFDPEGTRVEIMEPDTHDGNSVPASTCPLPIPDAFKK